jgi:threonine aldolase
MAADEAEMLKLRDQCTRFLTGHDPVRAADMLATIPPDTAIDRYGAGGVVTELEAEVARLLGKPAAVFVPSGTMAQQLTLRVHAQRRGRRAVVFHPMCHLEQHEGQAYRRLQRLTGRAAGDRNRLITMSDLTAIAEPVAVLLLELPQRDIGGQQPSWEELAEQCSWAAEHGAAAHLDGARLWESSAGYGRPPGEIAALFDTVYVSFYKGIGALAGCCVAGPEDIIAEVREWRQRMGGMLFGMWPAAASALSCLAVRLPKMPAPDADDAPAARHHPGALRAGGQDAGPGAGHLDLAAGHDNGGPWSAASGTVRRRRHVRPEPAGSCSFARIIYGRLVRFQLHCPKSWRKQPQCVFHQCARWPIGCRCRAGQ